VISLFKRAVKSQRPRSALLKRRSKNTDGADRLFDSLFLCHSFSPFTVLLNSASFGLIDPTSKDIFAILIEAK